MVRRIVTLVALGTFFGVAGVYAQESPSPGLVEVTYMPAGAAYFTRRTTLRASATTVSARPSPSISIAYVGIEGESGR